MKRSSTQLLSLVGGVLLSLGLIFLLAVVLPTTTKAEGAKSVPRFFTAQQASGRRIYIREGCASCHTRMVRDAASDASLGPAMSAASDYLGEGPSLIGLDRIGPDLSCVGNRLGEHVSTLQYLRYPAHVHPGSAMPKYASLTGTELEELAAYLESLTCAAVQP